MASMRMGLLIAAALAAWAEDLPRGRLIERVPCEANPSQSYALYLPSTYTPERVWPVIYGFDPRGRGRTPVERFQAAAERYGYVVAGSNNSRNGPWEASMAAVQAMSADVARRLPLDVRRMYTAGMSGGARVAMGVAMGSANVAGVIASSAGFPDSTPRKSVPFAIFGTAGTEDFNYLEMRRLDAKLESPHRVAIFAGGHTWLSSELAAEAIEWMELEAMKSGRRARDEALIARLFAKRAGASSLAEIESLAADFEGLRDVSGFAARAADMRRQRRVMEALRRAEQDLDREARWLETLAGLEQALGDPARRAESLMQLKDRLRDLSKKSQAPEDSPVRQMARRVLRSALAGSFERARDPEYRKFIESLRLGPRR